MMEKRQLEKEINSTMPLPKPKNQYNVTSKVKQQLESEPSKYMNARALAKALEKLRSKTPPTNPKAKT